MKDKGYERFVEESARRVNPYRRVRDWSGCNCDEVNIGRYTNPVIHNRRLALVDSEFNNQRSGRGVISLLGHKEGDHICYYLGKWLRGEVKGPRNVYIHEMGMTKMGDINRGVGAIINDSRDDNYNCDFYMTRGQELGIVATRDIAVGEELSIYYGEGYWCEELGFMRPVKVRGLNRDLIVTLEEA